MREYQIKELMATKIMGWYVWTEPWEESVGIPCSHQEYRDDKLKKGTRTSHVMQYQYWDPLNDPEDLQRCKDQIIKDGHTLKVDFDIDPSSGKKIDFGAWVDDVRYEVCCESEGLAVCKSILKAKGISQ